MKEEQARKIFMELLEVWEEAESVIINTRGSAEDYKWLEEERVRHLKKIDEVLEHKAQ